MTISVSNLKNLEQKTYSLKDEIAVSEKLFQKNITNNETNKGTDTNVKHEDNNDQMNTQYKRSSIMQYSSNMQNNIYNISSNQTTGDLCLVTRTHATAHTH